MRVALQGKVGKVGEGFSPTLAVDVAVRREATDHLLDFDVEKMRRVERLIRNEHPSFDGLGLRQAEQHLEHGRGVDNDQRRSRSIRIASAADIVGDVSAVSEG